MAKVISDELLKATTTMNNIKDHNYTVADYKMCQSESEVVLKALKAYVEALKYDERLNVI